MHARHGTRMVADQGSLALAAAFGNGGNDDCFSLKRGFGLSEEDLAVLTEAAREPHATLTPILPARAACSPFLR